MVKGREFDRLYNMTDADVAEERKALVEKRVKRGFSSSIDGMQDEVLTLKEKILDSRKAVANGNIEYIKVLAGYVLDLEETQDCIKKVGQEEKNLFGDTE